MDDTREPGDVIVGKSGSAGHIRLNRPAALNSLTLDMVRTIASTVERWEQADDIAAIVLTGEGDRAFCAGGDVRQIYDSLDRGPELAQTFWREEYIFNARIPSLRKPYVAVMDGITMGGGVGISAHGSHRIVTERTKIAMPEVGIGFFPDVGGTWLLSRSEQNFGTWLGLTGQAVGAADAIHAKLADIFVPSADIPAMIAAIEALPPDAGAADVTLELARFATTPEGGTTVAEKAEIADAFGRGTVEEIIAALAAIGTPFAKKTHDALLTKSPTSLKLTLRLLRQARKSASLKQCLEAEFAACQRIISAPDFREGIRAAVIDKDRNPRWSPTTLPEVTDAIIEPFFRPAPRPLFSS